MYCVLDCVFFFFKQKTAYEMRISDWSSDVCSSDLMAPLLGCMTPCRIVVDLGHPELPIDLLHLHHDVDEDLEQRAYVLTRQVCAAFAFLHQQRQLLEGQFGRIRVDRRNRAGMTAIDVAQVEKCGPIAQLLKKNAVGSHP